MIQFHMMGASAPVKNDWRANPYLCGLTDEPVVVEKASDAIDIFVEDEDDFECPF
jgi:hypothetical protein